MHREMGRRVWDGDRFHPGAADYLRRSSAVNLGGLAAIHACMVLMRFGLTKNAKQSQPAPSHLPNAELGDL
jgi:hypothetical protein